MTIGNMTKLRNYSLFKNTAVVENEISIFALEPTLLYFFFCKAYNCNVVKCLCENRDVE